MKRLGNKLKRILEITREDWDHPGERQVVRDNFRKVCECRTAALGAEVYESAAGRKLVFHTCKSKSCSSCGNRGTVLWQRSQSCALPDIPFIHITLTIPDYLWSIFKHHRNLRHDLPAVGASVIQQWVWKKYRVRMHVVGIQHTFGARLNHNPHTHIMVSAGGLNPVEASWMESLEFEPDMIMSLWRSAVVWYLRVAHKRALLRESSLPRRFIPLLDWQAQREWRINISGAMSKEHFLAYAGRYIRRPPVAQRRILKVTKEEVVYESYDKECQRTVEIRCTPQEFVARLALHVLDHYKHSMRYFGLLAPRTKKLTSDAVWAALGQQARPKALREPWNASLLRHFGVDPLIDDFGNQMHWVGRIAPIFA